MNKDYREITVIFSLFISAIFLILKSSYIIQIKIPCYLSCYSHLRIPLPFLTKLFFLLRHWCRIYFTSFLGIFISVFFACLLLGVLFLKKRIIPVITYSGIIIILLFFVLFSDKAMELPLNKLGGLKNKRFSAEELSKIKKEIESGRCPFQSRL